MVASRIDSIIRPTIDDLGFSIVRVQLSGKDTPCLQVMAEPHEKRPMTVEDCAKVSRAISALLDVEDPIVSAYSLEVSSPGLDRPLTKSEDYKEYAGFEAKIETDRLYDGRRKFRGRLKGIENEMIKIDIDGQIWEIPYTDIRKAKLMLTDDLIAASEASQTNE